MAKPCLSYPSASDHGEKIDEMIVYHDRSNWCVYFSSHQILLILVSRLNTKVQKKEKGIFLSVIILTGELLWTTIPAIVYACL